MSITSDPTTASSAYIPTILAVDDDLDILAILSDYLTESGFRVIVAKDCESTLKKVESDRPDLIVLDVVLPKIDGFETCRRLKANETSRDIPVIFMTGVTETASKVAGFSVGGADYITKPFEHEEILARIRTHLALNSIQKQLAAKNAQLQQEVLERKRVGEALRESEELHRVVLGSLSEAVFITDDAGALTFICPNVDAIFGYSFREVETFSNIAALLGEDLFVPSELEALDEIRNIEREISDKAGKVHNLLVTVKRVSIREGTRLHSCRDITERKQAEDALREAHAELEQRVQERTAELNQALTILRDETADRKKAEETARHERDFLQQIIDTIPTPIFYKDIDGRYLGCNTAFESFLGMSRADIVGKTVYEVVPKDLADVYREADGSLFNHPGVQRYETAMQDANGIRHEVFFTKATFSDFRGNVAGLVGVILDITERKRAEEALRESEERVKIKLDSILTPEGDIGALELDDIIDTQAIQSLMDSFFKLTNIGVGIIDLHGKVLVGTGWQDICTQFHRACPETRRYCVESDLMLSNDVAPNKFKIYKCKNNMWDIATPIMIGEKHMGNLFLGQFFFEDESPDYEAFRAQARQYGFDEEEYLAALDRVPRWSRETVNTVMTFYAQFAQMISKLSHSNIELARTVTERAKAEASLASSEQTLKSILSASPVGVSHTVDREIKWVNDAWLRMFGCEQEDDCIGKSARSLYPSEEEFERVGQILYQQLETGSVAQTVAKFQRKDGTLFDGEVRMKALNPSDTSEGGIGVVTDITARKGAEDALRLSEERYRLLVDKAPVGIISVDKNGAIVEVNRKLLQVLGSPSADATKAINMLSFAPLVDSGISGVFSTCLLYGTEQSAEIPYTSKWGKTSYLRILLTPLLDESGNCTGCQAVMEDVSERKKAEEALRQSEEKYRATFNNAAVGIDLVDCYGQFLEANDTLLDFLGYTREELRDLTILDCTHPSDSEKTKDRYHALIKGDIDGYRFEMRYIRKDGSTVWADTSVSAIRDEAGKYIATVGVIADITGRKSAEEESVRLATAIEQAAEAIMITDSEGTMAYVNPAFEATTGYLRWEAIGANPSILKSGQHDDSFYAALWRTISDGKVWSGHFVNKRKDGTLFEEEASISPVRDDSGRIVNYVAVKRDVTKEVGLQKQLLQAQKMEAIGTLAGGVAHDFNNLLQVVLGYSELVIMDKNEQDTEFGDLQRIVQAARSGADLVQRLLTFSRKTETKPRPLNLNHQIDRVKEMISRTVPKMIRIDLRLSDRLAKINADPTQMEQILMNLAVNARDAMQEGGKLTIETKNVFLDEDYSRTHLGTTPGQYVQLIVADTGQGMDRETVDHIFEPFFTTKQLGQGTGLGLAVVYGIVEQHGGHINCYSEPGQGTAFKIHFPALSSEPESVEPRVEPEARGGSETILLVDDEELIRDLGARILSMAGYSVLTAADGIEAVDLYEKNRPDIALVILDLIMPKMGGKQCLEELLKIDPEAKVLVASGFAADAPTKEALASGAKGFVDKPYDMQKVLRVVRDTLDAE